MSQNDNNKPAASSKPTVTLPVTLPGLPTGELPRLPQLPTIRQPVAPATQPAQPPAPVPYRSALFEAMQQRQPVAPATQPAQLKTIALPIVTPDEAALSGLEGEEVVAEKKSSAVAPATSTKPAAARRPVRARAVPRKERKITDHKVLVKIGDQEISFPAIFIAYRAGDPLTFGKYDPLVLADSKGQRKTANELVTNFLRGLAVACEDGLAMASFISSLETANLEVCIQALLDLNFKLPYQFPVLAPNAPKSKENRKALNPASNVVELLKERISICTDEKRLLALAEAYSWYIEASRRAVTLMHVSEKGLQPPIIKFIAHLCKNRPDLAFMVSPTTLHDNTIVDPKVARFFTCDPFGFDGKLDWSRQFIGSYQPVVTETTVEKFCGEKALQIQSREGADKHILKATKGIRGQDGFFPWFHPERPNTGVILGGGIVCAATMTEKQWQRTLDEGSDIDLFVYADTDDDRKAMVELLLRHFEALGGKLEHFKSVFQIKGLGRDIQVICPFARSPLGVLINYDFTNIQIGYQEIIRLPRAGDEATTITSKWYATPGHCFFTPRGQSLITRYNIRLPRLIKILHRGFLPVSDLRGHLLYPHKTYFSPLWQLELVGKHVLDETWVDVRARAGYADKMGVELPEDVEEKVALQEMAIKDQGLFEKELVYWRKRALEESANERMMVKILDVRHPSVTSVLPSLETVGVTIPVTVETPNYIFSDSIPSTKVDIDWVETTAAEAMTTFHPQGATLSNGFDIYTASVNSTLPLPEDGETENIYMESFLLRNVRIVRKDTVNLAAPQEKQLSKATVSLSDPQVSYPFPYNRGNVEMVREIEGVFLFGNPKTEEEVEDIIKAKFAQNEEKIAKRNVIRAAKARSWIARQKQCSEEEVDAEDIEQWLKGRPLYNAYDPERVGSQMRKTIAHGSSIDFKDLHSQMAEIPNISTVDVWELPLMIKAFGEGKNYLSARKRTIKKKYGMVRVRAPVTIEDSLVFDVDDLMTPLSSLDAFPNRRYNVVIRILNLAHWILKEHLHEDREVSRYTDKIFYDVMEAKLRDPEYNPEIKGREDKMKVTDFLRMLRHVANSKKVEEECLKAVCSKPHAHKGLPGQMPIIHCTRFYVNKHT
jgi:hypothetical protein